MSGATYDTRFAPNTTTYDILRINTKACNSSNNPTVEFSQSLQ